MITSERRVELKVREERKKGNTKALWGMESCIYKEDKFIKRCLILKESSNYEREKQHLMEARQKGIHKTTRS